MSSRAPRLAALAASALLVCARSGHAAGEAATPVVGTGSVLQVLLGLAIVLGMVFGAAWLVRRFNPVAGGTGIVRIVGGAAVGNRERVLVVEVADTWLVVGVAPGRVSSLHTLPRPADAVTSAPNPTPAVGFAHWLRQTLDKRNAANRNDA